MQHKLLKLVETADKTYIEGDEIRSYGTHTQDDPCKVYFRFYANPNVVVTALADQELELDEDGKAVGVDLSGAAITFNFEVVRPLSDSDMNCN